MRASMISARREPVEVSRLTVEAAAGHVEPDLIGAEGHLQDLQVQRVCGPVDKKTCSTLRATQATRTLRVTCPLLSQ